MKAIILAGGFGTRISEESYLKPKPMIMVGDKPILWHIMKIYSTYGINEFIICLGYKGNIIKEWFANYFLYTSDVTFDLHNNEMIVHRNMSEDWKVTLVDTGLNTMTGGRLKKVADYIGNETFCMTYGDGVADVNVKKLVEFHKSHHKFATLTAVNVEQRFGIIEMDKDNFIHDFREKSDGDSSLINGGFMVLEPEVFKYIKDDFTMFEKEPMQRIAQGNQLVAYIHNGFWQCMDTKRDKEYLEQLWESGKAPWKIWMDSSE